MVEMLLKDVARAECLHKTQALLSGWHSRRGCCATPRREAGVERLHYCSEEVAVTTAPC